MDGSNSSDDGGVTGYKWGFGDASAQSWASNAKTTHQYTKKGNYTITLTVVDAGSLEGSTSKTQNVKVQ